jgi:5-methylcytosine-specific restriction protein A
MRCIECESEATHRGRCEEHYRAYEERASVRARRKRRAVIARGSGAAARLRRAIRKAGRTKCARCGFPFLASAIDVDHITPIAHGGEDTDGNLQPLCRPCHKLKTREDFGVTTPPF